METLTAEEELIRLGELIRQQRQEREISQQKLADAAGLSIQQVRRIEQGSSVPNAIALARISKVLKVDPSVFLDHIIPESERIDLLWKEHDLSRKVAGSRAVDYKAKKTILKSMGLWK